VGEGRFFCVYPERGVENGWKESSLFGEYGGEVRGSVAAPFFF